MKLEDELWTAIETAILEKAQGGIASDDLVKQIKGRFSRDCYVPLLNWMQGELARLETKSGREAEDHLADLKHVCTTGMALALANIIRPGLKTDDKAGAVILGVFGKEFIHQWRAQRHDGR